MKSRIIEIYGGMTGEYEIILTNATNEQIEEQIKIISYLLDFDECLINPYALLESYGCEVIVLGSQDDDLRSQIEIDDEFDFYSY